MKRRVKAAVAAGVFIVALSVTLWGPVVSLGPRPPHIQASAQRAPAPPVAVPVQAIGSGVLSVVLTGALVVRERRALHARKGRRAPR